MSETGRKETVGKPPEARPGAFGARHTGAWGPLARYMTDANRRTIEAVGTASDERAERLAQVEQLFADH